MAKTVVLIVLLGAISVVKCKDEIDKLLDTVDDFIYGIDSKVVELNDDTFKKEMKKYDTAFVEFVAPWCPHCKRLTPDFERAAKVIDRNNIPVTFVKVNCDGPGYHTCHDAKADIYPTLKLFRSGVEERRYYGERTPRDLVRYALNMLGDHAKQIATKEELDKFTVSDGEYMFVGAFEADSPLKEEFLKVAEQQREFNRFSVVSNPQLLDVLGEKNAVLAYQPEFLRNKWEPHFKVFKGEPFDLFNFIKLAKIDLVGIINRQSVTDFEVARPLLLTTFDVDFEVNRKHTNYVRNRLLKLAHEYKGKISLCMGNLNMTHWYAPDDRYNDTGIVMTVITEQGWQYTVPKDIPFSYDNAKKVVEDTINGKIDAKPFMSDDPPATQKKRVQRVVAKTFHDVVLNEDKNCLIEFFSPYCGHCKALIPTYNELASRARKDPSLIIAKMDATSNSLPKPFESRGFPTIYFVPKGKSTRPIKYEGSRTIEDLIKFMQDNTKEELLFVEPEEKYLKKKETEKEEDKKDEGTCSADSSSGQCSAGKTEL